MNLKWLRVYLASYPIENKLKKKEGGGDKHVFIKLRLQLKDNSVFHTNFLVLLRSSYIFESNI